MTMSFVLLLALSSAPMPDGAFWVARPGRGSSLQFEGTVTEKSTPVECVELHVKGPLVTLGEFTFNQRDGRLFAPVFNNRSRPVPLVGTCDVEVPKAARYATRDACQAVPKRFVERCDGGDCTRNHEPFQLGPCEDEMRQLKGLASLALAVDHDDAMATIKRIDALTKKGGKLWEAGECAVVTVTPGKRGLVTLRGQTWEKEGYLEPLFAQARIQGTREWALGGSGLGTSGSSAQTESLLIGRRLIVLDRRVLYVDEGVCVAEGKKL